MTTAFVISLPIATGYRWQLVAMPDFSDLLSFSPSFGVVIVVLWLLLPLRLT